MSRVEAALQRGRSANHAPNRILVSRTSLRIYRLAQAEAEELADLLQRSAIIDDTFSAQLDALIAEHRRGQAHPEGGSVDDSPDEEGPDDDENAPD